MKVSLGRTINLGNYETYRVDVSLESDIPAGRKVEEIFDAVQKKVEERLKAICDPVEEALGDSEDRRKGSK